MNVYLKGVLVSPQSPGLAFRRRCRVLRRTCPRPRRRTPTPSPRSQHSRPTP